MCFGLLWGFKTSRMELHYLQKMQHAKISSICIRIYYPKKTQKPRLVLELIPSVRVSWGMIFLFLIRLSRKPCFFPKLSQRWKQNSFWKCVQHSGISKTLHLLFLSNLQLVYSIWKKVWKFSEEHHFLTLRNDFNFWERASFLWLISKNHERQSFLEVMIT